MPESKAGTCLVCNRTVPIVNYAMERSVDGTSREVGYLGRHWRPGIRRDAKCRGSFGPWRERTRSLPATPDTTA